MSCKIFVPSKRTCAFSVLKSKFLIELAIANFVTGVDSPLSMLSFIRLEPEMSKQSQGTVPSTLSKANISPGTRFEESIRSEF